MALPPDMSIPAKSMPAHIASGFIKQLADLHLMRCRPAARCMCGLRGSWWTCPLLWSKGTIPGFMAIRQAVAARGNCPCPPSKSLVVECSIDHRPVQRAAGSSLPSERHVVRSPGHTFEITTCPGNRIVRKYALKWGVLSGWWTDRAAT